MRNQSSLFNPNRLVVLCLFLATILFFSFPVSDADLGWHLRYGETFLSTGKVMRDNQFSWALPAYQWANHSWGFDVVAAMLFNGHRFWLLSLSAGTLIAASFFLVINKKNTIGMCLSMVIFWYFGSELLNSGLRSQLFSLLCTAMLWRMLQKDKLSSKSLMAIPLIFLLWANLHGQFIYGLGLLGLVSLFSKNRRMVLITIISTIITLINPFGFHLWQTALAHLGAPELKYILEWMPWDIHTPRMILLLIYTTIVCACIFKQKYPLKLVIPMLATTYFALSSRRMIPYFLILSLPIINHALAFPKLKYQSFIVSITTIGFIIYGLNSFWHYHIFSQSWDTYCQSDVLCSEAATRFIQTNHLAGKLFNSYRIGGYLDYRLPQLKPMIDGRMTLWHNPDDTSLYLQYTTMVYLQPKAKQLFYSINPDYVLMQPQYPLTQTLITQEHWPILFEDPHVVLLQNPRLK